MRRQVASGTLCIAVTQVLLGCSASVPTSPASSLSSAPPEPRALVLDFDDGAVAPGDVVPRVENAGTERAEIVIATAAGGRLVRDRSRSSYAVRFPAVTTEARAGSAAIVVRPAEPDSVLSPGSAEFRFGADFRLDALSEFSEDNGDNLLQRGSFSAPAQYKLQLDHGVVSCRVSGTRGAVVVEMEPPVRRNEWYRATCARSGNEVTLVVALAEDEGAWADPDVAVATGPIGRLVFDDEVPLTVGAKVSDAGEIVVSDPDQFNGSVDRVFFERIR